MRYIWTKPTDWTKITILIIICERKQNQAKGKSFSHCWYPLFLSAQITVASIVSFFPSLLGENIFKICEGWQEYWVDEKSVQHWTKEIVSGIKNLTLSFSLFFSLMTRFSSRRYSTQRLQYFRVNIPNGIYLSRQLYWWNRKIMPKLIISLLVLKKIRMYIKYESSFQRAIIRFYHVKTLSLARQKQARQTKIYSVHFHGVRSFSCCTLTVLLFLGQNSTCLVSTSVLIHLNISILTKKLPYLYC